MDNNKSLEYWAAGETSKCADEVRDRIDQYYQFLSQNGYLSLWGKIYASYYEGMFRGGVINDAGAQAEFKVMSVNHFRNLIEHIQQLVQSTRPAFEPRAINSDAKSLKQAMLAKGLLDYYMREKRLENQLFSATEFALCFGEGFIVSTWNATDGKQVAADPDTERPIHEGDILYEAKEPIDIIRDPRLDNYRSRDWIVVRSYINRYELMAKYPEYATKISQIQTEVNPRHHYRANLADQRKFDTDQIILYTFYHARTAACPDGRQMQLLDDDITLTDGPLGYRHLPVYRMVSKERIGTPMGHTVAYDLSALQEAYNLTFNTILTNQAMFGVQNVFVPKGAGFNVVDMAGGLRFVEYDANMPKPEPMNLLHTPQEVYNFLGGIEQQMMTISGINNVTRGDPQASLKSGAALALIQSMAIQFNQGLQFGYAKLIEDVGTATVQMLQDYAAAPRTAAIAGKYNRSWVEEFTGEDLNMIDRVVVDIGNPVLQTAAGKVELAGQMLQAKLINDPSELLMVMQTGNLEPLIEGRTSELMGIRSENEYLQNGQTVAVMLTDDHRTHIQEHKCIAADPSVRQDPNKMNILIDHIQQHLDILMNPQLAPVLVAMGQQPFPPAQPPAGPAGGPGPQVPPQPGTNANAQVAGMQPNMPNNALTGQQFNPQTGGL